MQLSEAFVANLEAEWTMIGHIERIRVFVEVAERESFAAAARALGLTRSQVTRYVSDLEADIGVRLLTRTTRQVALSAAGRLYLQRAKPILADLSRAEELVRLQHDTLKGDLRVSAPLSFGLRFLPDAISQFRILYPEVRLKLDLTDRLIDVMKEDYDMALRISGPPNDKSSIWRKIRPAPRALFAAPAYLARKGRPESPDELADHDCLLYAHGEEDGAWELRSVATEEYQKPKLTTCLACNNGDLIGDLAVRGEGIALLPRFIVAAHLARGALVEVMRGWETREIWLSAFYPPYDNLPAKVATFTSFIESAVGADSAALG
jgi:DNA-binding transcriptional LysR family regulator